MNKRVTYIDFLLSLKKNSQFEPFVIEWLPLYGVDKRTEWVKDLNNQGPEGISPGPEFKDLLERLLPTIERYPYAWPLEGQKIDPEGYDFSHTESGINLEPVAYTEALRVLGLSPMEPDKTNPYTESERVSAPHVTKFQLTLEKASPLSTLSFQFFSANPVELLSLVSERDLSGASSPETINLKQLQLQQSGDTVTVLFGKPIFTKRLTFVLGQKSATSNTYFVKQEGEDFTYQPENGDSEKLKGFVSTYHNGHTFQTDDILSDKELTDWSEDRKKAYLSWRREARKAGIYE